MTLAYLKNRLNEFTEKHPLLTEELTDFFILACDEVLEGNSETQECELALDRMEELIKETTNE